MSDNFLLLEPGGHRIGFAPGDTISQALSEAGYAQNNPCGGRGKCGKCRLRTSDAAVPTAAERDVLSEEELAAGWRLACVSPAHSGMTVWLPEFDEQDLRILTAEDTAGAAEWDCKSAGFKLGCDIGTTTVVIYLLHPENGRILHTVSSLNGQIGFGGDVISRIFAVCDDFAKLRELQDAIKDTIDQLLRRLYQETGLEPRQIAELRVAGNTTMEHLLLAEDPRGLGKSPFTPAFLAHEPVRAGELGLKELPATAPVSLIPNLSAFVGGDITAGIYYTKMAESDKLNLLLDIGTNNEMVLGNRDAMYACSAAAGPALEGAQISTGMRAAAGAVEKVWLDTGRLELATIGNAPPCGLCGSGLIDLLAVLVRAGVVLPNGRFADAEDLPEGDLRERLRKGGKRHSEFVYCRAGERGAAADLALTQKDVREAQLAKSAIAVGIDKLLERMDATMEQLDSVYLAGAFGNYIDQHNACCLGILPRVAEEKIKPVRNSAGLGVCHSMFDPEAEKEIANVAALCQPLNLAAEDDFQQRFLERLKF